MVGPDRTQPTAPPEGYDRSGCGKMLFMRVTPHGSVELAHSELGFFRYLIFCGLNSFKFSCSRKETFEQPPSESPEWPIQCAGANSRKLDKQLVLPKKAVRPLTNRRLLMPRTL